MTITRPFYRFATLFLFGVLAWTGMASAQQSNASKADAPSPTGVASAGRHRQPAKTSPPQSEHAPVTPKRTKSRAANALDKEDNKGSSDHYQPGQRNLIGQYQNAVTPPPVDVRR